MPDPQWAVWIALAINIAGVLMMLGAKRQQMKDQERRLLEAEEKVDELERTKLAIDDYRREYRELQIRISDADKRAGDRAGELVARIVRVEERGFNARGGRG
jgi:uncharacterized protein HemX